MHALLVHNRESGSADSVDPAAILAARGCTVVEADIATAARWVRTGPPRRLGSVQRVVVAGGDGSIGPCAALAALLGVPIGVVPAGTANDFARSLDLPSELERAVVLAVTGDALRTIDVADLDGRPYVNVASIGLAPHAAATASRLKSRLGALAYPLGALAATVRARPIHVVAEVDGSTAWNGPAWQAMIASTGAFGGWADVGPTIDGDGQLDLVIVPADRATRDLVFDAAALVRGELAQRDGVVHVRGRDLVLRTRTRARVVLDGEHLRASHRQQHATVARGTAQVVVG